MIEISNLTFEYANNDSKSQVLCGLNLTIKEGESIGLMGPNGSGKTTLARCLNGLLIPTNGEVLVDELSTGKPENLLEIRRKIGIVFQNPENQIVSTTVEREIAFGVENLGIPYEAMHEMVDKALAQFNLTQYRNHPPHLLSGGEMQRLALASIVVMSPKYLIFDEPTSLLDLATRQWVLALISELQEKNCTQQTTPFFITQYSEEVLQFDRLLILNQGEILFDDAPSEIFKKVEELQKIGINVPVEYEVNHYLKKASDGEVSFNPSDFLPIL